MRHQPVIDSVRSARANVRLATRMCGAAGLGDFAKAFRLLETAATQLRVVEAEVQAGGSRDLVELQGETVLLKREVAILLRAIDGLAALRRGLSLRLGSASPGYTSQGRAVSAPPGAEACELLG